MEHRRGIATGRKKSSSLWRAGVDRHFVRPMAAEWRLLHVQRSVASQDDEWQGSAAAVVSVQNLTDCSQWRIQPVDATH